MPIGLVCRRRVLGTPLHIRAPGSQIEALQGSRLPELDHGDPRAQSRHGGPRLGDRDIRRQVQPRAMRLIPRRRRSRCRLPSPIGRAHI
ncbi:hypothetical protein NL676_032482 [Syzygium grande]|nr:hypothetical protein NL676_032482 [Syzygium grande]